VCRFGIGFVLIDRLGERVARDKVDGDLILVS